MTTKALTQSGGQSGGYLALILLVGVLVVMGYILADHLRYGRAETAEEVTRTALWERVHGDLLHWQNLPPDRHMVVASCMLKRVTTPGSCKFGYASPSFYVASCEHQMCAVAVVGLCGEEPVIVTAYPSDEAGLKRRIQADACVLMGPQDALYVLQNMP